MKKYLIWDWNGTLLDDTHAALNAFNAQLAKRALAPITLEFYRRNFAFPVKPFYALCGIDLANEDWERLAAEYHEAYAREPKDLNSEARAALGTARARGYRQCILSALREDLLRSALAHYEIADCFDFVYGVDNLDGASKSARAKELMRQLDGEVVLIGDSIHDAEVARELGVKCVLVATGGHSAERLAAHAPTVNTLLEAIKLIP